jgi:putative aldouronate transport system permease protein
MVEKQKSPARIGFLIFNTVFLGFMIVICIAPVWHVVVSSFSDASVVMQNTGVMWRIKGFNLEGYKLVFNNKSIWTGYFNTFVYVIGSTVLGMVVTMMISFTTSRKDSLWASPIMFLMAFTMLFNGGLISSYIVNTRLLHLYDNRLAMILPSCFSVFNAIIMRTAISAVPASLEESATLDGAGHMTILFRIMLPLIKPTIATLILFSVVGQWNSWFNASIYLRNRELFPLQLIMQEILIANDTASVTTSGGSSSQFSADLVMYKQLVKYCVIVVSTVPIFILYPFVQKYFEKGVLVGAIKG